MSVGRLMVYVWLAMVAGGAGSGWTLTMTMNGTAIGAPATAVIQWAAALAVLVLGWRDYQRGVLIADRTERRVRR